MSPSYVALADLSGNGRLDIIVGDAAGGQVSGGQEISVLMNLGGGKFAAPVYYGGLFGEPTGLAVGDFNGNGKLDIAVPDGGDDIAVFAGNGDGTFQFDANYATAPGPIGLTSGPFFGPGQTDLAVGITVNNSLDLFKANRP